MLGLFIVFVKTFDYFLYDLGSQVGYIDDVFVLGDTVDIKMSGNTLVRFKENHESFLTKYTKNDGSISTSNTKSSYWLNDGESLKIDYSASIYSSGSSGIIKVGIVRIPSGCTYITTSFNPTTFIYSDTNVPGLTSLIDKDSNICFAVITNDQMKYDITYSTQYQHDIWVYGSDYGNQYGRLYTSSTAETKTANYTSSPLVFYLKSDGVNSSRYISLTVSSLTVPSPSRSLSPSPSRSPSPSPSRSPSPSPSRSPSPSPSRSPSPSPSRSPSPSQSLVPQPTQSAYTYSIYTMNEQVRVFEYYLYNGETLDISLDGDFYFRFYDNYDSFQTTVTSPSGFTTSGNIQDTFYIAANYRVTILYGPYVGNTGVSGSLKFGIVRIPSGCTSFTTDFNPNTFIYSDTNVPGLTSLIDKDSNICFAVITNDQMKYDITYSTQYQHDIWVYGPQYGNKLGRLYTSSTAETKTANYTSLPLLFYLQSDGVNSSRYISLTVSSLTVPSPSRSLSPSPSKSGNPSGNSNNNNSSSSSSGSSIETVAIIVFVLVAIVGVVFFVTQNKKQDIKSSSSSNQEKKEKKKKKKSDKKDKKHKLKDIPEHVPQPSPPQYSVPPPQQYPYPPQQYPYPPQQQFYNPGYPPSQYNQNPIAPPQSTTPKTQVEQI